MAGFREIAIDPSVVDNWTKLQLLDQAFGFNRGKLIAKFPFKGPNKREKHRNWEWEVLESIRANDVKKWKRAEAFLTNKAFRKKLLNLNRSFDFDNEWVVNARTSHRSLPFDAILCDTPDEENQEYNLDDLNSLDENCPDFWRDNQSFSLRKLASEMANTFAPLLRASNHIVFVDPYFDPSRPKWQKPLRQFIRTTTDNNGRRPKFELHFSLQGIEASPGRDISPTGLLAECKEKFAFDLPKNLSLRCAVWDRIPEEQRFHARFILTDLAGVASEHGLDEAGQNEEFEFFLMADDHCKKASERFLEGGNGTYELLSELEIEGQREA